MTETSRTMIELIRGLQADTAIVIYTKSGRTVFGRVSSDISHLADAIVLAKTDEQGNTHPDETHCYVAHRDIVGFDW